MLMVDTKSRVQKIAAGNGMSFNQFAARCLLRDLSYETARNVWYGRKVGDRGYTSGTKLIVSKVLRCPVAEVFPED
jgi:hypothetical protein